MAFYASGVVKLSGGRTGSLGWDNGTLSGDADLVDELIARAERLTGTAVGPVEGPYTTAKHLASGLSAAVLITDVFERDSLQVWGDVPMREPLDADSIG
jgi:hypothetical protein